MDMRSQLKALREPQRDDMRSLVKSKRAAKSRTAKCSKCGGLMKCASCGSSTVAM